MLVIDDDNEEKYVEFLSQNEIEEFALNPNEFTTSIYNRIIKLDGGDKLESLSKCIQDECEKIHAMIDSLKCAQLYKLQLDTQNKERKTNQNIVESLEGDEYKRLSKDLRDKGKQLLDLARSKRELSKCIESLGSVLSE